MKLCLEPSPTHGGQVRRGGSEATLEVGSWASKHGEGETPLRAATGSAVPCFCEEAGGPVGWHPRDTLKLWKNHWG